MLIKENMLHRLVPYLLIGSILILVSCNDNGISNVPENTTEDPFINQDSNLPQLVVSLQGEEIVDEPKVPALLKIYEQGEITYDGHIGIEFRGATSQALFPKKSFGVETWDASGDDIDAELLGFPEEEDWIFYGPYSDKTLIRNAFVYRLPAILAVMPPAHNLQSCIWMRITGGFMCLWRK